MNGGSKLKKLIVTCLVLFALWLLISDKDKKAISGSIHAATADPSHPDPREGVLRDVKLTFHWSKGGFGSVMLADFKVDNPTAYRFKDFEVTCTDFGPSGTEIDSNKRTIYQVVVPKSSKSIKRVNMGFVHSQTSTSSCEITDLVIDPGSAGVK
jgi:hypothetical protein